jgi:hypothetical protein
MADTFAFCALIAPFHAAIAPLRALMRFFRCFRFASERAAAARYVFSDVSTIALRQAT